MANKKDKIPLEWVNIIFFVFLLILVAIVFGINNKMHSILFLIIIWIVIAILAIVLKSIVLSGDREINSKEVIDISLSSFLSTLLIIGSMMLTINYVPIVSRAFENTVGYWFINNEELANALSNVFTKPSELDINLIATQLFYDENIDNFYANIKGVTQFTGVTPPVTFNDTSIRALYGIILNKHNKSKATLASLATIAAFYTSYLPIKNPWINNS